MTWRWKLAFRIQAKSFGTHQRQICKSLAATETPTQVKSYFQLPNDIQTIKNDLNSLHRMWKDSGFDKQSTTHVDFKAKRNEYRSAIRKFIQCKENSKIVDLCKASEVDEKLFWKMLKKGKGKGKTTCFLVDGKFINTDLDITNMWADHFETLGQSTTDDSYDENFRIKVESAVEQIFAECVSTLSCTEPSFVYDTMKEVCQGLKCGVAGGPDMITYEHLRYGGPVLWDNLSKLYFSLFISCSVPSKFRTFFILPLFKGKGAKACDRDSYRGIAMFSVFFKVFELILVRQLEKVAEEKGYFLQLQFGFREGVSCLDASFVISESINHLTETGGKAFACFMDVRKAFDTVWIDGLLYKLKYELGIDPKMWLIIKVLFSGLKGQVIFNGHISSSFSTSQGSGQGRILAPFLYKVYINQLLI